MTDQDIKIINSQSDATLAEWWCTLNSYKWVIQLPNPEPAEYINGGRRGQIMHYIKDKIGFKSCLRRWNDGMTEMEFEIFWIENFGGK